MKRVLMAIIFAFLSITFVAGGVFLLQGCSQSAPKDSGGGISDSPENPDDDVKPNANMTVYGEMYTMDTSGNYPSSPASGGGTMILRVTGDDGTDCGETSSSSSTASHRNNNGDPWWGKWKGVAKVKTTSGWSYGNFAGNTGFTFSHIYCSGCSKDINYDSYDDAKHGIIHTHSISCGIWDTVSVTYKYYFKRNTYAVLFDANNGLCAQSSKSVYYQASVGTLPTPVRSGYQFDGWYTAASGGSQIKTSTTITSSVTYYAHWTLNSCCVTLYPSSGSIPATTGWDGSGSLASKDAYAFESYGTLPTPTRTGYTFLGWRKNLLNIYDYADFINSKTDRTNMNYVSFSDKSVLNMNPEQNYHLVNGEQQAYLYQVNLPVAGRYRLSYYAKNDRSDTNVAGAFRIATNGSTVTAVGTENNYINSQTRTKYTGVYNVTAAGAVGVYFSWHYAGMCHLDTIMLELITPTSGSWPSSAFADSTTKHAATELLTAEWKIKTYTLHINYYSGTTDSTKLTTTSASCYVADATLSPPSSSSSYTFTYATHTFSTTSQAIVFQLPSAGSYTYYLRTGSAPTLSSYNNIFTSSTDSYTYNWTPTGNSTINIYVYQRYTIYYNSNNGSGSMLSNQYKIYGTSIALRTNSLTRTSYSANGWNTNKAGTGTAYTSGGAYSANSNATLYADWTPLYGTVTVKIMTSEDGTSWIHSSTGGTAAIEYYYSKDNENYYRFFKMESDSRTVQSLLSKAVVISGVSNEGYLFVGISSSSGFAPYNNSTVSLTPASNMSYTRYVYFVKNTNNKLKYDSTDKYYYFEDGYFPQSYVGATLNSTLSNASNLTSDRSLKYMNGKGGTISIPIYIYDGSKYAMFKRSNVIRWFKVEPIRWRVSEYGVDRSAVPNNFADYGRLYKNFKVVSDRVLWVGAVTRTDTKESWEFNSSTMRTYFKEIYQKNGAAVSDEMPIYASSNVEKSYYYGPVGQQEKVKYITSTYTGINIATEEEIKTNLTDLRAKASDMVAFILGLDEDSYCDYWTRELGGSLKNGKMITKSGMTRSAWLQNFYGVRFSLRMSEGNRA